MLALLCRARSQSSSREPEGQGEGLLNHFLSEVQQGDCDQVVAELAADFAGLFLNASVHSVHPYESVYTSPERLLMQDARDQVRKIYKTHGLGLSGEWNEPEDHIALELEFMSRLCARIAESYEKSDSKNFRLDCKAQRDFLTDHLLRWAPQFCEDLACASTTDLYRALGLLLGEFLETERVQLDGDFETMRCSGR